MTLRAAFVVAFSMSCYVGCGSEPADQEAATLQAGVIDAGGPVSGVRYETELESGVTDSEGRFTYLDGESVSFWLGDTLLGSTSGRPLVTPFDLAGAPPPAQTRPSRGHLGAQNWRYEPESPLHHATNVTVLLQTLDRDGDAANGITISEEVARLFDGVSVDFFPPEVINESERAITTFRRNRAFRTVLQRANASGLFEGYRTPVEPAAALQALYDHLELEPPGFVAVREENAEHVQIESWLAPLVPLTVRSLDSRGMVERVEQDTDGDGVFDVEMRAERNARGHLTRVSYDVDGDGAPEATESIDRDYDENGDPTRVETRRDGSANQPPLSVVLSEYDALGAVLRTAQDDDGDGALERVSIAEYDREGRIVLATTDDDADGILDRSVMRSFRDDGQLLEQTVLTSPRHGTRGSYEYDEAGQLTALVRVDVVTSETVWDETRSYDAEGRLERLHWDRGPFSPVSRTETLGYDGSGRLASREVYHGGSNRTDRETWRYGSFGNVERYAEDRGNNGEAERIIESRFDGDGRLIQRATTSVGCVGTELVTTVERWAYDDEGRQVRYEVGFEGFRPHEEETWSYGGDRLLRREGRNGFGTWTFDYQNEAYTQTVTKVVSPGVILCPVPSEDPDGPLAGTSEVASVLELKPATWWHILGSDTGRTELREWLPLVE